MFLNMCKHNKINTQFFFFLFIYFFYGSNPKTLSCDSALHVP